jgi:two-component system response regulator HydG
VSAEPGGVVEGKTVRPGTVRLLVVDDDPAQGEAIREGLERVGYDCEVAESGEKAIEALQRSRFDLVLTDLVMRDRDGIEILKEARRRDAGVSVLIFTGHGTIEAAVRAMKEGASDFLEKPIQLDALRLRVAREIEARAMRHEIEDLRRALDRRYGFEEFVGQTPEVLRLLEKVAQIAPTNATVLLLGETGTGKELVARAIHRHSPRREGRFVAVNSAGFAENLIESELFGHEKGAFTGAVSTKQGLLEVADGGTLFLDEIGDMPPSIQAKLLRVLENREVVRVGGTRPIRVDVRVLAATNVDLRARIQEGKFREDLFFRLAVVTLLLPPLRGRPSDVALLLDHSLQRFALEHRKDIRGFSAEARARLLRYSWPGNVRELRNTVEAMVVTARGPRLGVEDLPPPIADASPAAPEGGGWKALAGRPLEEIEKEAIRETLSLVGGNREKCAQLLGIGERTLYRKLKDYGLT